MRTTRGSAASKHRGRAVDIFVAATTTARLKTVVVAVTLIVVIVVFFTLQECGGGWHSTPQFADDIPQ